MIIAVCCEKMLIHKNLTSKINIRAGGVTQAVEHLSSKCEVLSSNLSIANQTTTKIKNK
jgi:hypothetical protein